MTAWLVDRLLPPVCATQLALLAAYLRLHFEKRWPYWGRREEDEERKTGT